MNDEANKTGYHAAKYVKQVYEEHQLELPVILVHTMNLVGRENIEKVFESKKVTK